MRRTRRFAPTLEDVLELSGVEALHPGGMALTRRTAEVAGLAAGLEVLDVSSGPGVLAVYYATEYGVDVTGLDISPDMVMRSANRAAEAGVTDHVRFRLGDSQELPFPDGRFDAVINECAVGIPDDSQAVLNEMVRVVRPGGSVVIHESTWMKPLDQRAKAEFADRYGTTPLEAGEWISMLEKAGLEAVDRELEPWSRSGMFWQVRPGRDIAGPSQVLSLRERLLTTWRVLARHGVGGALRARRNENHVVRGILSGVLGYGLYWGRKPGGRQPAG